MTDWREEARARCEAARSGSISYRLNLAMWKDLPRALAELDEKDAEIARLRGLLGRCAVVDDAQD